MEYVYNKDTLHLYIQAGTQYSDEGFWSEGLSEGSKNIAKKSDLNFFTEKVQEEMKKNNDHREARFVEVMRNWYRAVDEKGGRVMREK